MTREELIDELNNRIGFETDNESYAMSESEKEFYRDILNVLEQEPKIIKTIDFAINASNGDTDYFVGLRNGMRYVKSLIDGKEPQFESCAEQEPKTGHWISYNWQESGLGITRWGIKCDQCNKQYKYGGEMGGTYRYCPNCGAKMEG